MCGRSAVRFRFGGRLDEAVKVRGMFVYPEQIDEALGRFNVEHWRARVTRDDGGLDVFTVEVTGEHDRDTLAAALKGHVRVRADVVTVDDIPADAPRLEDLRA